jgi:hypothetical protein
MGASVVQVATVKLEPLKCLHREVSMAAMVHRLLSKTLHKDCECAF